MNAVNSTSAQARTGTSRRTLRAVRSGLIAAEVTSLVIPARLPAAARSALGIPDPDDPAPPLSQTPLGVVLAGLGTHREPLGVRLANDPADSGNRILVESSARMWLGDLPVALATERVTAELCLRASRQAARTQDEIFPGSGLPSCAARRAGATAGPSRGRRRIEPSAP